MNTLLYYSMPILLHCIAAKNKVNVNNLYEFKQAIIESIVHFDQELKNASYHRLDHLAARYCLCSLIDERIHKLDNEISKKWSAEPLLHIFHQDSWGGERVYLIIETISKQAQQHLDLIELCYVILSLGFEGMYFADNSHLRESVRKQLYQIVNNKRQRLSRSLRFNCQTALKQQSLLSKQHYRHIGLATATLCIGLFIGYNLIINTQLSTTVKQLNKIGRESIINCFSQLIDRSVL